MTEVQFCLIWWCLLPCHSSELVLWCIFSPSGRSSRHEMSSPAERWDVATNKAPSSTRTLISTEDMALHLGWPIYRQIWQSLTSDEGMSVFYRHTRYSCLASHDACSMSIFIFSWILLVPPYFNITDTHVHSTDMTCTVLTFLKFIILFDQSELGTNFLYNGTKNVSSVPLDNVCPGTSNWLKSAWITSKPMCESLARVLSIQVPCWFHHKRTQDPTWKSSSCIKA